MKVFRPIFVGFICLQFLLSTLTPLTASSRYFPSYRHDPSAAAANFNFSLRRFEKSLADGRTLVRDHSWWDYLTSGKIETIEFFEKKHTIFEKLNKRMVSYIGGTLYFEFAKLDDFDRQLMASSDSCRHQEFDRHWEARAVKALQIEDLIARMEKEMLAFYTKMKLDWIKRKDTNLGQLKTLLGIDPESAADLGADYYLLNEEEKIQVEFLKARTEFFNYYEGDLNDLFNKIYKDRDAVIKLLDGAKDTLTRYGVTEIRFNASCEVEKDYCPIDYYQKGRELGSKLFFRTDRQGDAKDAFEHYTNIGNPDHNSEILDGIRSLETPLSGREGTSNADLAERMSKLPVGLQKNILALLREIAREQSRYFRWGGDGYDSRDKSKENVRVLRYLLEDYPEGSMMHEGVKALSGLTGWDETYREFYARITSSMHQRAGQLLKKRPDLLEFLNRDREKMNRWEIEWHDATRNQLWMAEDFENLSRYQKVINQDKADDAQRARSQDVRSLLDEDIGGELGENEVGMNSPADWQGVRQLEAAFDAETPAEQDELLDAWEQDIRKRVFEEAFDMTDEDVDKLLAEVTAEDEGLPLPDLKQSSNNFDLQEFKELIDQDAKKPKQILATLDKDLLAASQLTEDALLGMSANFDADLRGLESIEPASKTFDAGGSQCKISDEVAVYSPTAGNFQSIISSCTGTYVYESQSPEAFKQQGFEQDFEFFNAGTGEIINLPDNENISISLCSNGYGGDFIRDENERIIAFSYSAVVGAAMAAGEQGKAIFSEKDSQEAEKGFEQLLNDFANFGLSFDGGGQNIGNDGLPAAPTIDDGPTFAPPMLNDFQPDQTIGNGGGNNFGGGGQTIGRR